MRQLRMMRALGPGSVSSFLKVILDVVFAGLWIAVGAVGLMMLAGLLLSFNPELINQISITVAGTDVLAKWPVMAGSFLATAAYLAGLLVIVERLRKIFATLTAGDPFHPDNVTRLRVIGLALAALELGRYVVWIASAWLLPGKTRVEPDLSLTSWFSVLVVFVLAEVFREGARLRREAELTI